MHTLNAFGALEACMIGDGIRLGNESRIVEVLIYDFTWDMMMIAYCRPCYVLKRGYIDLE